MKLLEHIHNMMCKSPNNPLIEGQARLESSLTELKEATEIGFKKVIQSHDVLQELAKNMKRARSQPKARPKKVSAK